MVSNEIPHHSREDIQMRAEGHLRRYLSRTLEKPCATPVLELTLLAQKELGFAFTFDEPLGTNSKGERVYGACFFSPRLAIAVDPTLAGDTQSPRFRFVLAHELGHLTLHRKLRLDFSSLDASRAGILDGRHDLRMGRRRLETPRDWLEWQANSYAASLLMPRVTFVNAVRNFQTAAGVRWAGRVFVDSQSQDIATYDQLLKELAFTYQTSRTATRIRLQELSLVEDHRFPSEAFDFPQGPVAIGSILAGLLATLEVEGEVGDA